MSEYSEFAGFDHKELWFGPKQATTCDLKDDFSDTLLAQHLRDPRQGGRVRHSSLSLVRQRVYQIVAGYEDANDADRLRHNPAFQLLADQPWVSP